MTIIPNTKDILLKQCQTYSQYRQRLQDFAQIAYQEVPTQEAMLNGGVPLPEKAPSPHADPDLTRKFDEILYEAAQQGNIGGD